jgi:uncharacterized membrane protein YhaH (DUF805 family)
MFMPLKRYFEFSGRSRRKEYWMFFLFWVIAFYVIMYLDSALGLGGTSSGYAEDGSVGFKMTGGILTWVFFAATVVPLLAAGIRRMHDQNKSGWFILIPLYNLVLLFTEGTRGPNRFGPDPKGGPADAEAFS